MGWHRVPLARMTTIEKCKKPLVFLEVPEEDQLQIGAFMSQFLASGNRPTSFGVIPAPAFEFAASSMALILVSLRLPG